MARVPEPGEGPDPAQPPPEPDPFGWAGPIRGVHRPRDARVEGEVPPPQGAAGVSADPEQAPGAGAPGPPPGVRT